MEKKDEHAPESDPPTPTTDEGATEDVSLALTLFPLSSVKESEQSQAETKNRWTEGQIILLAESLCRLLAESLSSPNPREHITGSDVFHYIQANCPELAEQKTRQQIKDKVEKERRKYYDIYVKQLLDSEPSSSSSKIKAGTVPDGQRPAKIPKVSSMIVYRYFSTNFKEAVVPPALPPPSLPLREAAPIPVPEPADQTLLREMIRILGEMNESMKGMHEELKELVKGKKQI